MVLMNELDNNKILLMAKFSNEILHIKNSEILSKIINSVKSQDQLDDIVAELEIAAFHLDKKHSLEYEPKELKKPPDFKVNCNEYEFYEEVKSVRRHSDLIKQGKIRQDLKSRIEKIKKPYLIYLGLYYNQLFDSHLNKLIAGFIKDVISDIELNKDIEIIINNEVVGHFEILRELKDSNNCKLENSHIFSYGDMTDKIMNQIEYANYKSMPEGKPFIVIIKLPDHVDEYEIENSINGKYSIEIFRHKDTKKAIVRSIRTDRIFGRDDKLKNIDAIIFYKNKFEPNNCYYSLNKNSKVDDDFIKRFYVDCKKIECN